MSFADNLQYLRKKNKITQEELSEELSVSRQSVSKWETGEAYPEMDKLIILCDKFGVTLDELMRGNVIEEDGEVNGEIEDMHQAEEEKDGDEEQTVKEAGCCSCGGGHSLGKNAVIGTAISSAAMIICAIVYLCLGFTIGIWHPTWIVFLGGILVCIWSGGLTEEESGKTKREKIGGMICGTTMVSAVIIFLSIGFTLNIWHPTWVVFIIGTGICAVVGAFTNRKQ